MRHPFQAISGGKRLRAVMVLLVLTAALRKAMWAHVKTGAAPHGMLSFALAGDAARARRIVASWDGEAR